MMSAINAVTGTEYRGGNILRLLGAEAEHGYSDAGGWAGFKQWLSVGRVVRKGEHGTACLTVVTVTDDAGTKRKPRGFRVFHYDQTCELAAEVVTPAEPVNVAPVPVVNLTPQRECYCPDDCACHHSWRTTVCGCAALEHEDAAEVPEPVAIDNSAAAVDARRAMFARFGHTVTQ